MPTDQYDAEPETSNPAKRGVDNPQRRRTEERPF